MHKPPRPLPISHACMCCGAIMQVVRLSSQDVPTAYAYELEAATIVQPEQVVDAAKKIVPQRQLAYA